MQDRHKIGRNDPCPCGSGKKHKKCCGSATHPQVPADKEVDYFKLNREIAYQGSIGQEREGFCIRYIAHKKTLFNKFKQQQLESAQAKGETVTCHIGCTFCCMDNISASLGECEAIVYYLYQNEAVLETFLRQYPEWQAQLDENKTEVDKLVRLFNQMCNSALTEESREAYLKQAIVYKSLGIPCSFLHDNRCLIYEVRPWVCASIAATTPDEWCNPAHLNWSKRSIIEFYPEHPVELPFYYGNSKHHIYEVIMPFMVYQILRRGFRYIKTLRDLEGL